MLEVHYGGRATGRTAKAIGRLFEEPDLILVVIDHREQSRVQHLIREVYYDAGEIDQDKLHSIERRVITFGSRTPYGTSPRPHFLIDNLDICLSMMFPGPIEATVTKE